MAGNPPPVLAVRVGPPPAVALAIPMAQAVVVAPAQQQPAPQDASHRLNHKKLHITLAALEVDEISNEAVLAMARTRGQLIEWSIGDEIHPSPADPSRPRHKHYFLHYSTPINHRDARYCQLFDMAGRNGRRLHPHIQGVGPKKEDRKKVIYYTQKDKLYIASRNLLNFDAEVSDAPSWALEMNRAESVRGAMLHLQERHPEQFYLHADRVQHALEMRIGYSEPSPYALTDFIPDPLSAALLKSKAIVIQGASHIGKTQFALAHFRFPLLISEMDDLKSISLRTDGLVFDQMRFTHADDRAKLNMTPDEIIRVLDIECQRSIAARYRNARIPRGMPRIFTTNRRVLEGQPIFPRGDNAQEQEGIDSRIQVTRYLTDDLRRNPAANARGGGP